MSEHLEIRPLGGEDLPQVARLHMVAFPRSAMTRLGAEAVCRYYEWQMAGPHDAFFIGAWEGNRLRGYVFAGRFRGAMSGFMRRNAGFLVLRILARPAALASNEMRRGVREGVRVLWRFVLRERLRRVGGDARARRDPGWNASSQRCGVLAIAVDPLWHGTGVGDLLMDEVEREALARGFAELHLSVDVSNARAIRFYERRGWGKVAGVSGAWTGSMERALPEAGDDG